MANIITAPESGIYFDGNTAGVADIPTLTGNASGVAIQYDGYAGIEINSSATGANYLDRFSVEGANGRLFGVTDEVTGTVFSVNDAAGLPIIEVESTADFDKITIGEYGTDALVVSGNNVGIGTASPATKLEVNDAASPILTLRNPSANPANAGMIKFIESTNTDGFQLTFNGSDNKLKFISDISGTEAVRMVIQRADGNVGIGTTTPATKFHVEGDPVSTGVLAKFKGSADYGSLLQFDRGDSYNWKAGIGGGSASAGIPSSYFGIVETANTPRLVIAHTTGNVGIGTTSPSNKLTVEDTIGIKRSGVTAITTLQQTGTGLELNAPAGYHPFVIKYNNTEFVRFKNDGNVGIGTTSPNALLELSKNGGGSSTTLLNVGGTGNGRMLVRHIDGKLHTSDATDDLYLNYVSSGHISMVNGGGNVGIGTNSPSSKLHVAGQIMISPSSGTPSLKFQDSGTTNAYIDLTDGQQRFDFRDDSDTVMSVTLNTLRVGIGTTSPTNKLDIRQSTSGGSDVIGTGAITIGSDNPYWTIRGTATSLQDLAFDRNYAGTWYESMRIQRSTGNVGIGTTGPTAQLESIAPDGNKSSLRLGRSDTSIIWDFNHAGGDLRIWNSAASGSDILLGVDSGGTVKNNNVGIGTASPDKKLNVHSGTTSDIVKFQNNNGSIVIGKTANLGSLDMASDASFRIRHGSAVSAFFKSDGNVGIGTTSPSAPLDISSSATGGTTIELDNTSTGGRNWTLYSSGSGNSFGAGKFALYDADAASVRMLVDTSGNVGIGTTSPITKLDVSSGAANDARIRVKTGDSNAGAYFQARSGTDGFYGLELYHQSTAKWFIGGYGVNRLGFFVGEKSTAANEKMSLTTAGNVGIGTTSPDQKLHVLKGSAGSVTSNGDAIITAENSQAGYIQLLVPNANESGVLFGNVSSTASGGIIYNNSGTSNGLQFRTNGNLTRMAIDSSGNVGIGTTSPQSLLHVNGEAQIGATSYQDDMNGGKADFSVDCGGTPQISWIGNYLQAGGTDQNWAMRLYTGALQTYNQDLYVIAGGTGTTNKLHLGTNGQNSTIVCNDGNVGIGTTTPDQKLEVNGNAHLNYSLIGRGIRSSNRGELHLNATSTNDVSEIFFGHGDGYTEGNIRWAISDRGFTDGRLDLYSGPAFGGFSVIQSWDENGNVGIGTTSPAEKLTVIGDILIDNGGNSTLYLGKGAEGVDGVTKIKAVQTGADTDQLGIAFNVHPNTAGSAVSEEAMRIDHDGNVGIGTTSPVTTLHVNGSIGAYTSDYAAGSTGSRLLMKTFASTGDTYSLIQAQDLGGISNNVLALQPYGDSVGIGTTTPAYKLDVNGTLRATGAATFDSNVTVTGDLTVNGTTTTINSTTISVDDKNIELGSVATPTDTTADGGGITLKGATDKTINWVNSTDAWTFSDRIAIPYGSESAPSLTFSSSTNTGIYGASTFLRLVVGGVWKASIASNGITSNGFIKTGGSSSEFLKADGSVDSSTYLTTSGTAADSNLLDGIDSSSFLRSDADDTATGTYIFSNTVYFGTNPSNAGRIEIADNSTTDYKLRILGTGTRAFELQGSGSTANFLTSFTNASTGAHNISVSGSGTFSANLTVNGGGIVLGGTGRIQGIDTVSAGTDAVNKFYADTKAPLASPALTGNPTAPTPSTSDNDTSIATTAFVKAQGYITDVGGKITKKISGDGSATTFTVTHNFGTPLVMTQLLDYGDNGTGATYEVVNASIQRSSDNAIDVLFGSAPSSSEDYLVLMTKMPAIS